MTKPRGATFDRELTMRSMERSALDLLEEHGVLAGLNLREVAERAGVNRGLVYHYFGSRRALVRSSLRRTFEMTDARLRFDPTPKPLSMVMPRLWRAATGFGDRWRTALLLLLDRDEIRITGNWRRTRGVIQEAQAMGLVDESVDNRTMSAVHWSLVYGYSAIRERIAHDLGLAPEVLDGRVEDMLVQMYSALDGPEAASAPREDGAATVED